MAADRLRVAFFGTPRPAVPALDAFATAADVDVVAAVTNPDRPAGRGHELTAPPVKVAAQAAGIDVWQPRRAHEILPRLRDAAVDACAVVAYGSILPAEVLAAGGAGFVNLHFSLLPAWRGAAPVPASILAGDRITGVTCFRLDEGMDTGDVLLRHEVRILPDETAGELTERLAVLGGPLLLDAVRGLVDGSLPLQPQDHPAATYAGKFGPDDARLDLSDSAEHIDRMVRAYNPFPGAHTTVDGARLKIHRATPLSRGASAGVPAGTVVDTDDGRPVIACGDGLLRLDQVQPAGKPRMDGRDYANGYRPQRLGT